LDISVVTLWRSLLNRISLRDWRPCLALLAKVNEPVAKIGRELAFDLTCGPYDFTSCIEVAALRRPAAHASDDARVGIFDAPGQHPRRDHHAQRCGKERKAIHDRTHLGMRLCSDGENFRQREELFPVPEKLHFNLVRAEVNQMALPVPTDRAVVTLHGIK